MRLSLVSQYLAFACFIGACLFIAGSFERKTFAPGPVVVLSDQVDLEISALSPWEDYARAFHARDLFAPYELKAPIDQSATSFRVAGLMLGEKKSIFIEDQVNRRLLALTEGEEREGVRAKTVGPDQVELEVAGIVHQLKVQGGVL